MLSCAIMLHIAANRTNSNKQLWQLLCRVRHWARAGVQKANRLPAGGWRRCHRQSRQVPVRPPAHDRNAFITPFVFRSAHPMGALTGAAHNGPPRINE
jgi:hypothetical protein